MTVMGFVGTGREIYGTGRSETIPRPHRSLPPANAAVILRENAARASNAANGAKADGKTGWSALEFAHDLRPLRRAAPSSIRRGRMLKPKRPAVTAHAL